MGAAVWRELEGFLRRIQDAVLEATYATVC